MMSRRFIALMIALSACYSLSVYAIAIVEYGSGYWLGTN